LHFVYIPRVNQSLKTFQEGWNSHGIRTAGHLSPKQLFIQGALRLQSSGLIALDFFNHVSDSYGISNDDPSPTEETGSVTVPQSRLTLQPQQLQEEVNPLSESDT